jgi:hypothetical protein
MVIPVAEAVEKQLMIILRDKEQVLHEALDVVQRNLNMMHETVDFIEDLVSFGQNQVSVVFGEYSAVNRLFMSGVAPFLENMDEIFATVSSLVAFKRGNLNSFLSEDYNRCCTALHCIALHCTALHCIALHCTALHCIALHCTALHCIALHCTALHCIALHCTALHCIALHCILQECSDGGPDASVPPGSIPASRQIPSFL